MPELPPWFMSGAITVLTTLVTTIAGMAKYIETKYRNEVTTLQATVERLEVKEEACAKDRDEFRLRLAIIESKIEKPGG